MLNQLMRKLHNMVLRAQAFKVDDTLKTQTLQVGLRANQVRDGVEHLQNYGFTHHAPTDAGDVLVLCANGDSEQALAILVNDRKYRLRGLESGEVAMYDDQAQAVMLKRDGIQIITDKKLIVDAPETKFKGDIEVEGSSKMKSIDAEKLTATDDVIASGKSLKLHTHSGVQSGPSTTGPAQ